MVHDGVLLLLLSGNSSISSSESLMNSSSSSKPMNFLGAAFGAAEGLETEDGQWTDNLRDAILGGSSTSASDEGSEEDASSSEGS
jgi:hypothetical protein